MIKKFDISGSWQLTLDKDCKGGLLAFTDSITLPDTTSNARKGSNDRQSN